MTSERRRSANRPGNSVTSQGLNRDRGTLDTAEAFQQRLGQASAVLTLPGVLYLSRWSPGPQLPGNAQRGAGREGSAPAPAAQKSSPDSPGAEASVNTQRRCRGLREHMVQLQGPQ